MKILLCTDGSSCSESAIQELGSRPWPTGTRVEVLSVSHPSPDVFDPLLVGSAFHLDSLNKERKRAHHDVDEAVASIKSRTPFLEVSGKILDGSPKEVILKEAADWGADLVVVGSHGYGTVARFLLGSVAQAVAAQAPCSVEIVRTPKNGVTLPA